MKCLYCSSEMVQIVNEFGKPIKMSLASEQANPMALMLGVPMTVLQFEMMLCKECHWVPITCNPDQLKPVPKVKDKLTVLKGGKDEG